MKRTNTSQHSHRWLVVVLTAALSGACATAGTVARPPATTVPGAWSRSVEGTTTKVEGLARWWERLGDPVLTGVVEQALRANPDLRIATARLRQARAQRNLAQANLLPSVSAAGSVSAVKRSQSDATAGLSASRRSGAGHLRRPEERKAAARRPGGDRGGSARTGVAGREVALNYDLRDYQARLAIAGEPRHPARDAALTEWRGRSRSQRGRRTGPCQRCADSAQIPSLQTNIVQANTARGAGRPSAHSRQTARHVYAHPPCRPHRLHIPAESLRQRWRAGRRTHSGRNGAFGGGAVARYPSWPARLAGHGRGDGRYRRTSLVARWTEASCRRSSTGRIRQQIEIRGAVQTGGRHL
jgi:hypothetical protein